MNVANHKIHEKPKKIQAMILRTIPTSAIVIRVSQKAKNRVPHENGLKGRPGRFEVTICNLHHFSLSDSTAAINTDVVAKILSDIIE